MSYKFLACSLFSLALLTSISGHAAVGKSGVYVGMSAGGAYARSKTKMRNDSKMENHAAFVASLALGLRFRYVRAALEATMNTKAEYKTYTYENNSASLQFYYDVPFRSRVRPFFNVGAGISENKMTTEPNVDAKANKAFWNLGGGFSFAISPSTNVDLGYRYSRIPKLGFSDANGQKISVENEIHAGYLGVRYVF